MSKSKNKNYRTEDNKYYDGYGVDRRKDSVIDKRKERRFERALKVKSLNDLYEDEDYDDYDHRPIDDDWK